MLERFLIRPGRPALWVALAACVCLWAAGESYAQSQSQMPQAPGQQQPQAPGQQPPQQPGQQPAAPTPPPEPTPPAQLASAVAILDSLCVHYAPKAPEDLSLIAEFRFLPGGEAWHVNITPPRQVTLAQGSNTQAAFIFSMTPALLQSVYDGDISASTCLLKTSPTENPPIIFQAASPAGRLVDMPGTMMEFVQRFFNPTSPEVTVFDDAHAREVRGTDVVALYNAIGLRSAWYQVNKDQRLKEPGTVYPQALIFLSGTGLARIGEQTVPVKAGEAYYVPPGKEREIWTEEDTPLVMLRIAWGKGA